jgi:hypothetical protein
MSSRRDFYHRQRVTEAELDEAFEALEQADRDFASDLSIHGVISGAVAVPHSPVPDLTVDLTAPGRAYDRLGRRVFIAAGQRVDVARDLNNLPTQVPQAGQERWVGVYIRFSRLLSEPRTDGNGQVVYWKRDESFEVVVRQGAAAAVGQAQRPALEPDELLVADIKRRFNQTQIVAADINADRRQVFIFSPADNISVEADGWSVLGPPAETVQSTFDHLDEILDNHFDGDALRHTAGTVNATAHGFLTQTTVQGQLDQVVDVLAVNTAGNAGSKQIGADTVAGTPFAMTAGTVDAQLSTLNSNLNSHATSASAHAADSITAAVHGHIGGTTVQSQLQEIVSDLSTTSVGASGAERVGVDAITGNPNGLTAGTLRAQLAALLSAINGHVTVASAAHAASAISVADANDRLTAQTVEAALNEALEAFEAGHFRGNQDTPGQHRVIRQPAFASSGLALLWDARGITGGLRLRVYMSSFGFWMTLNASTSDGVTWTKDSSVQTASALRLENSTFSLQVHLPTAVTFSNWTSRWYLPMSSDSNSGWNAEGAIKEVGRFALETMNTHTAARQVVIGMAVNFRSSFAPASTVTFQRDSSLTTVADDPERYNVSGGGFVARIMPTGVSAGGHVRWVGTYTAA